MFLKLELILVAVFLGIVDGAHSASINNLSKSDNLGPFALLDGQASDQYLAVGKVKFSIGGFCTGTLISSNVVLTAAHCLTDPMTLKNPVGPCGEGGSTDFYSGDLFQTVSFEVQTSMGNHTYTGLTAKSFGSRLGKDDVGLIVLAQQVPNTLVRPIKLLPIEPETGEHVVTLGYGCQFREYSKECGTFVPSQGGLLGKKQIVYSKFGTPAYNGCPGDSGGPWLKTSNLGIYGVSSYSKGKMSVEDRRSSQEPTSFAGDVNRHFKAIEQIISITKDLCSDLQFQDGEKVFKSGKCMEISNCQANHGRMSSGNCPNHTGEIGCCHTEDDPVFKGLLFK